MQKPDYSKQFWETLYYKYLSKHQNNHNLAFPALLSENKHLWKLGKIPTLDGLKEIYRLTQSANSLTQGLLFRFMYENVELTPENKKILMHWYKGAHDDAVRKAALCTEDLNELCDTKYVLDSSCLNIFLSNDPYLYYDELKACINQYENFEIYKKDPLFKLLFQQCFIEWVTLEKLITAKPRNDKNNTVSGVTVDIASFETIAQLCQNEVPLWLNHITELCKTREDLYKFYVGWTSLSTSKAMDSYITQYATYIHDKPRYSTKYAKYNKDTPALLEMFKLMILKLNTEFKSEALISNLIQESSDIDDFDLYQQRKAIMTMPKLEACDYPSI